MGGFLGSDPQSLLIMQQMLGQNQPPQVPPAPGLAGGQLTPMPPMAQGPIGGQVPLQPPQQTPAPSPTTSPQSWHSRQNIEKLLANFLYSFGSGMVAGSQARPGAEGGAAFGGALQAPMALAEQKAKMAETLARAHYFGVSRDIWAQAMQERAREAANRAQTELEIQKQKTGMIPFQQQMLESVAAQKNWMVTPFGMWDNKKGDWAGNTPTTMGPVTITDDLKQQFPILQGIPTGRALKMSDFASMMRAGAFSNIPVQIGPEPGFPAGGVGSFNRVTGTVGPPQAPGASAARIEQAVGPEGNPQFMSALAAITSKSMPLPAVKTPAQVIANATYAQGGLEKLNESLSIMQELEKTGVMGSLPANWIENWLFGKGAVDPSLDPHTRELIGRLRMSLSLTASATMRAHLRSAVDIYQDYKKELGPGQDWNALKGALYVTNGLLNHYVEAASTTSMQQLITPNRKAQQLAKDPFEGRTATGPGGQRIIRRNGKWEPIK